MSGNIIQAKNPSNTFQPLTVDSNGRLECSVNELEITADSINVNVADLETLQTAANNTLSSIDNKVILPSVLNSDQLKTNDAAAIAQLTTANGHLSSIATGVTVSGVSTEAKQDSLISTLGDTNNKIDAMRGSNSITDLATKLNAGLPSALSSDRLKCVLDANLADTNTKLDTIAGDTTSLDGKITACNTGAIAGSVTANAGTNLNTSALALESGGNLATIAGDTTSLDGKITACNTGAIAGSVTANAGTNLNTSALALESGGNLATIAGDTTSLDSKITQGSDATLSNAQQVLCYGRDNSGTLDVLRTDASGHLEVVVDDFVKGQATMANSFPVTLASNQSNLNVAIASGGFDGAVTNAGTFAVQVDGDALTSLQLIDDVVKAEDSAHSNADKGIACLAVRKDTQTQLAGNDADYGMLQTNATGALRVHNNKAYTSEAAYISSQSVGGSSTHTGSTVANDPNISLYLFEHNFSGSDVSYEIEESIDNSNFFATGQSFNQAGDPTTGLTGLNGANIQAPFFRIKFTNDNASSRNVTLSFVSVINQ